MINHKVKAEAATRKPFVVVRYVQLISLLLSILWLSLAFQCVNVSRVRIHS